MTTPTHLADGLITTAMAAIYTNGNSTSARVLVMSVTNIGSVIETVTINRDSTGTDRQVVTFKLPIGVSVIIPEMSGAVIPTTKTISASTTTASSVNFQIDGDVFT